MNNISIIKEYKKIKNNKYNLNVINFGIEVLLSFILFDVVFLHLMGKKNITKFLLQSIYNCVIFYASTFYIISFYFYYNILVEKHTKKIKRFIRIFIPYFIWPIFFWFGNIIFDYKNITIDKNYFKLICYQLVIGSGFYSVI